MSFLLNVISSAIGKFRGSQNDLLKATGKARGNTHEVQTMFGPGIEINPAEGEKLVITKISGSSSYMVSIAGTNQNIAPDTSPGERKIYSVSEDGKTVKSIAKFKNDGVLELNGATDSAVKFADLKSGFDQLKTDFNNLVTLFNSHPHTGVTTGPGSSGPPASPATSTTASIDASESADVKLS